MENYFGAFGNQIMLVEQWEQVLKKAKKFLRGPQRQVDEWRAESSDLDYMERIFGMINMKRLS